MRTPWVVLLLAANVVTKSDDEWKTNYEHVGAWVGSSLESSPIFFQGKLYLMQSQMGPFPRDGSNGSHSFFCVMDGRTGEEVSCPPSSSGHAFCSSIVDHTGPTERAWVFCSAWDRANQTSCRDPLWSGPPDVATVFPAFLRLDSVRVAQQQAEERESQNE